MRDREPLAAATDQELLARVRSGENDAYGELWRRHSGAVTAIVRLETRLDADDLTAEAFTRILAAIRGGNGPDTAFRPYALVAVRNLAAEWGKRGRREIPVAEESLDADSGEPPVEEVIVVVPHRHAAARVFSSLPVRWQEVLWYLEVEQLTAAEAAPLVGLNANSTVQLAFRAREGFRQAWIQEHLRGRPAGTQDCVWVDPRVGRYVRDKLAVVERGRLERHVAVCERCGALVEEGRRVEHGAIFVLLPTLLLGGVASGYLAAAANGETRRSQETGEPPPIRFAKSARPALRRPRHRVASTRSNAPSALVAVAASAAVLVAVVAGIAVAQTSVRATAVAQPVASATPVTRDTAVPAPTVARVPTPVPEIRTPPQAVVPDTERDEVDARDGSAAAPIAPAPVMMQPTPIVAVPSSVVVIPEGFAYPHIVGTGVPGATIEVLVDHTGSAMPLIGVIDAAGAFKLDAVMPGLIGTHWSVARQVVDGVASAWTAPFKVTIQPPPAGTWSWASAGKFKFITSAVTPLAPIDVFVDGLLAATITPTMNSGETFMVTTASLSPVVTARYATGLDPAPIATIPEA